MITIPLPIMSNVIFSLNNNHAVKTVTNGSKQRKAPTLFAGNSFIASAHKTYAKPEQKIPRKISALQSIADNKDTLLKKLEDIVTGERRTNMVRNR